MNNSKIVLDRVSLSLEDTVDNTEQLREREAILTRILEAVHGVKSSEGWSTLKKLVFDGRVEHLEKQLLSESLKNDVNTPELYRLQGRYYEALKYDLDKLVETYRTELLNLKKITQPTER